MPPLTLSQKNAQPKAVICATATPKGEVLSGDSEGDIIVWSSSGGHIEHLIDKAHKGPVFDLQVDETGFVSASRDGVLKSWTWDYKVRLLRY